MQIILHYGDVTNTTVIFQFKSTGYTAVTWLGGFGGCTGSYYGGCFDNGGLWITYSGTIINMNKLSTENYKTIALVYHDNNTVRCYIDGEDLMGGTPYGTNSNSKLYFGKGPTSGGYGASNGYYKNIAIYDTVLTDEEIANFEFDYQ